MAQRVTIDAEINAIRANTQLSDLERRIAILAQRSTGIRLSFDNDGQLTRQVETVVDRFGRIQTITTRWHDEIREVTNDTGELERVTERVQEQTTTINNNLEKRAKLAEKLRKEEQQLLELEQQRSRIAAQARQAELQQSIDAKRQAMSYSSDPDAVMSAARSYYHAQQQAEYEAMFAEIDRQNELAEAERQRALATEFATRQDRMAADASARYKDEQAELAEATRIAQEQQASFAQHVEIVQGALLRLADYGFRKLREAMKEALDEMKAVDSELVIVRKVTGATEAEIQQLSDHAYEVGKQYGVAASEYLSSVAEMSRAGYKDQSADLAELAVKLQIVGDVSEETANKFLIATDKAYGFNGDVEKLSATIDQLNEIDNNFATSIQKMADGMGIIAPIASQAHVSLNELEAALGTITATTQRSGAESARALRALFLNIMGDTKTEIEEGATWTAGEIEGLRDVLNLFARDAVEAAEKAGEVVNPMRAIESLSRSYKEGILTEAKLMEMVSDIGGKLRASQLMALIQNWDMYVAMLEKTEDAAGSADTEVERALNSWDRKIKVLTNTWTDFIQKTISTDMIKNFITGITNLVEYFGDLEGALQVVIPLMVALFANKIVEWASFGADAIRGLVSSLTDLGSSSISASGALTLVSLAISAIIAVYKAEQKQLQDTIKAQKESLEKSNEVANNRLKLYNAYKSSVKGSDDYLSASKQLTEQLKSENKIAGTLFGTYEKLAERYEAMGDSFASFTKESITKSVSDANALLSSTAQDLTGAALGLNANALSASKLQFYKGTKGSVWRGVSEEVSSRIVGMFNGTFKNGADGLLEYYNALLSAKEELEKEALATSNNDILKTGFFSDTAYKRIVNQISAIEDQAKAYDDARNALGKQLAMQDIFNKDILQGIKTQDDFNKVIDYASTSIIPGYADGFKEIISSVFPQFVEGTDKNKSELETTSLAFVGLKDDIKGATDALEKYKEAISGGEHGDAVRQYAEAYKKAKELYEKGYFGSTQYQAALDLLLPDDIKQKLGYNYKELGDYVFGEFASGAWDALYGSDGEDNGAILATYLRDNAEGMEDVYSVINDNGETFDLLIKDEDELAKRLGMTTEQIYAFMDALDIHHSDVMLSTKDVQKLIEKYGDLSSGIITDSVGMIQQFVNDGRTESEIRNIIDQLSRTGHLDVGSLPEDLSETIEKFEELKKQEEDLPDNITIDVKTEPESGYFDEVISEIDLVNGKKIVIGVTYEKTDSPDFTLPDDSHGGDSGKTWNTQSNWQGVDSATAGRSLINENGAELVVRGKEAFIVNNGKPTLFDLKTGDRVFNAKETRQIVDAGVGTAPSAKNVASTIGGGIKETYLDDSSDDTSNSGGGGGGKKPSGSSVKDSDLLSMLSDYIKDLLDKAKKALDAQIDAIDAQIDALKKQHDAEEEANELEELRLKILEAEKNLVDANVERTVRYFNKATGQWEWMADQKAVAEAQKALEDAQQAYYDKLAEMEYQAKLDELNAQKEALKENYNALSDNWNDIKDEISKALNKKDVLSLAEILTKLGLTAASGSVGGVNSLIAGINAFTGSFDNGGFAFGKGFLLKGVSKGETVLDESITDRILSPKSNSQFTNFTNSLTKLFGMSSGDIGAKAQSLINSIDRSSNISGDTYYINGVRIGSDMMDRPLSEILSVLPIYAS